MSMSLTKRTVHLYLIKDILFEMYGRNLISREKIEELFPGKHNWEYDLIDFEDFCNQAIINIRKNVGDETLSEYIKISGYITYENILKLI